MIVHVTRDKGTEEDHLVFIWDRKPENEGNGDVIEWGCGGGYSLQGISIYDFKKEFGFTPKKGSCEEMVMILNRNISITEVKVNNEDKINC